MHIHQDTPIDLDELLQVQYSFNIVVAHSFLWHSKHKTLINHCNKTSVSHLC